MILTETWVISDKCLVNRHSLWEFLQRIIGNTLYIISDTDGLYVFPRGKYDKPLIFRRESMFNVEQGDSEIAFTYYTGELRNLGENIDLDKLNPDQTFVIIFEKSSIQS